MEMVREMTEMGKKDIFDDLFKGTVHPLSDKTHLYELTCTAHVHAVTTTYQGTNMYQRSCKSKR